MRAAALQFTHINRVDPREGRIVLEGAVSIAGEGWNYGTAGPGAETGEDQLVTVQRGHVSGEGCLGRVTLGTKDPIRTIGRSQQEEARAPARTAALKVSNSA